MRTASLEPCPSPIGTLVNRAVLALVFACGLAPIAFADIQNDKAALREALRQGEALRKQGEIDAALPFLEKAEKLALKVYLPDLVDALPEDDREKAQARYARAMAKAPPDAPAVFARLGDLYCGRGIDEKSSGPALVWAIAQYNYVHEMLGEAKQTLPAYVDAWEGQFFAMGLDKNGNHAILEDFSRAYLDYLLKFDEQLQKSDPKGQRVLRVLDTLADAQYQVGTAPSLGAVPLDERRAKIREAVETRRRALPRRERAFGADSLEAAASLEKMVAEGSSYDAVEPDRLASDWKRAIAIREAKLPAEPAAFSRTVYNFATWLGRRNQDAEAERVLRRRLALDQTLDNSIGNIVSCLGYLAQICRWQQRFAEAADLHTRAVELESKLPEGPSPDLLLRAAELDRLAGRYPEAKAVMRRGVELTKASLPRCYTLEIKKRVESAVKNCREVGEYGLAADLCREGIRYLRDRPAGSEAASEWDQEKLVKTSFSLHCLLMDILRAAGECDAAEKVAQDAAALKNPDTGKRPAESDENGPYLDALVMIDNAQGRYPEAEEILTREIRLLEARFKALSDPAKADYSVEKYSLALALLKLSDHFAALGQYDKAEPLLERRLRLVTLEANPQKHASFLIDRAYLAYQKGDLAVAESYADRGLKILDVDGSAFGRDDRLYAYAIRAAVFDDQGQHEIAAELYLRCLKINEADSGAETLAAAANDYDLAIVYLNQGKTADADAAIGRCLAIRRALLPVNHPDLAPAHEVLARVRERQGRPADAAAEIDRARRIVRGYVTRILPALSETEQLTFLREKDEAHYHRALTLAAGRRAAVSADLSAAWPLNGKGMVQETLARRTLQALDAADPAKKEAVEELIRVRKQLATLELSSTKPAAKPAPGGDPKPKTPEPDAAKQERAVLLKTLADREDELSRQLARGREGRIAARWIEVDELRRALPEGTAFIDVARFTDRPLNRPVNAPNGAEPTERYAAWVIPAADRGPVRIVDLGPAEAIDAAVKQAREAVVNSRQVILAEGEPRAEERARKAFEALAARVVRPLLAVDPARQATRWIVSPDSALWLIPWGALPLDDGRYAIEARAIDYAVSGRDLLLRTDAALPRPGLPALVVANPDFDLDATPPIGRALPNPDAARHDRTTRGLKLGHAARLPGTAAEALAVMPNLGAYVRAEPTLATGNGATATVVESADRPGVLVLSTHAYFLPPATPAPPASLAPDRDPDRPGGGARLVEQDNPLLRCGLLLAGCNRRDGARPGRDDGILTGLEVIGMDLRGTSLVVLSACETGLGAVRNGEGVAGLRQAFQLAGAANVMASLWQVPDRETARLMDGLFHHLARDQDSGIAASEALRRSQLDMIRYRRQRNAAAHPFYWAAFTTTISGARPR